jgi:CDP-6-deoxy-D-xylo-4-hexulose-3-dehydrase
MNINLVEDNISIDDINSLCDWLKTNPKLTQGDLVKSFEEKFAELIGCKHAIFVNSGSSANMMLAYFMKENGISKKVVIPAICWATDLSPFIQLDIEPIICDCNLEDLSVDYQKLEYIFKTQRPGALLLVSVLGMSPNMKAISSLCEKYDVQLYDDNCESLLTKIKGEKGYLGSKYSEASSFSTFYGHHMSTIEGGFVTTNDKKTNTIMRMLRAHGWTRDIDSKIKDRIKKRYNYDDFEEKYKFIIPGFNFRNTEIAAFLGLRQLEKIKNKMQTRINNSIYFYNNAIVDWRPKEIPTFAIPIIAKSVRQRDVLINRLKNEGIDCRPLIAGNIANHPVYKLYCNVDSNVYENADRVDKLGLYLPNHDKLSNEDLDKMIGVVNDITDKYSR